MRVSDDVDSTAWQWFGTMSVAPNGRIDVIWNDTRNDPDGYRSQLYYAYSHDAGVTWSRNIAVTPLWIHTSAAPIRRRSAITTTWSPMTSA